MVLGQGGVVYTRRTFTFHIAMHEGYNPAHEKMMGEAAFINESFDRYDVLRTGEKPPEAQETERGWEHHDADGKLVAKSEKWNDRQVTQFSYAEDGSHIEHGLLTETGDEEKEGRMVERHYESRDVAINVNGAAASGQLFEYGFTKFPNAVARESAQHGGDLPEPSEWFAKVRIDDPETLAAMDFGTLLKQGSNEGGEWREYQASQEMIDLGITVGEQSYHNRLNKISVDYTLVDGVMMPIKATVRFHGAERAS